MHVVVDGSENIFLCDMFRNQVVNVTFDRLFDLFDIGIFLQDLFQNRVVYFLVDAKFRTQQYRMYGFRQRRET